MGFDDGAEFVRGLLNIPKKVERILGNKSSIQKVGEKYANYDDMLFLCRKSMFPIAFEGALKLKEISYIHSEGYPSAEMKHEPIALVSSKCPCFFMVTQKDILHKTISNIQEVKARGSPVIAVISKPCLIAAEYVDDSIVIPDSHDALLPILATVPLQLFTKSITISAGKWPKGYPIIIITHMIDLFQIHNDKILTYLKECIIKYMTKIIIYNLIFGENIHEALIPTAYTLLSFLYKNKAFKSEQIKHLWNLSQDKYQTISENIITLFGRLLIST